MKRKKRKRFELDIPGDLIPVRTARWEENEDGQVQVRMQKFEGRLGKWLCRVLRKPNYALARLDELGSFIWRRCDGSTTIEDILAELDEEMGDRFEVEEELEKRTFYFFHMLQTRGFITWRKKGKTETGE